VGGQASIYSVVWILLPIVGSKEDVKHACFLVGYAVDAAKKATGKMYLFPRKPTKVFKFSNSYR